MRHTHIKHEKLENTENAFAYQLHVCIHWILKLVDELL